MARTLDELRKQYSKNSSAMRGPMGRGPGGPGGPPGRHMRGSGKPKNTKKTILRLLSYIKEYKVGLFLVLIFMALHTVTSLVASYLLAPIIDKITLTLNPDAEIKVIGIRHGEKLYETLLTNEECANAIDMGEFYRVPSDNRGLNYDKYFKDGDAERNHLTEFNSNNTELMDVEAVKAKLLTLSYIREELDKRGIKY